VVYADELERELSVEADSGLQVELVEHVVAIGWTRIDDSDFCPSHGG
jgi:hypothetical protein